ncbi:MAG: transglycosylase SLT domain-containing protein [Bacteroidales bacterium]|nr:transglycosylase SLT domain-containing protein [Bacteroidales bacterium]
MATTALVVCLFIHRSPRAIVPPKPIQYVENKTNTLNVLLFCHPSDYFVYRGKTIGFQYELLQLMADSLGKELNITFSNSPDEVKSHFFTSDYDIISFDLEPDQPGKELLCLSEVHSTTHPVLMRHAKDPRDSVVFVYEPYGFPGVCVRDSFPEGHQWQIVPHDSLNAEELVELLQSDSIRYMVTDYATAIMLDPFYSNLHIVKQVGPEYERRWILNPANVSKNDSINQWLVNYKQTVEYAKMCDKYFHPHSKYVRNAAREKRKGRISSYDAVIKRYATQKNIDWRFVCAIIYQESKFMVDLVGTGGSFGIMQLMPWTAERYGVDEDSPVEAQIYAGVCLLASLQKRFADVEEQDDRLAMVAAAYNAGSGHLVDARKLCEKYGGDPNSWAEVSQYLILKKDRQYYTDPVVTCGYYPGKHSVDYSERAMSLYHGYKMSLPH